MKKVRRLPLHHACNVRDLGGYPIDDERMTKWHTLYRADGLQNLDEHDWMYLSRCNIRWIIDLRSASESAQMSYDCEAYGMHYVSLPFMKEEQDPSQLLDEEAKKKFLDSMKLDYEVMMNDVPQQIVKAMDLIAQALSQKEGVLFHCSAGKDRTGMLSVLLLALCGVQKYDLLADYQVSATYNTEGINQMLPKEMLAVPQVKALFESTPEMMEPLVNFLLETGCKEYLLSIGCSETSLDLIQKSFIA